MTIICNTNKIVYLRPMKCASTSFEYFYYELAKRSFFNCSIFCDTGLCLTAFDENSYKHKKLELYLLKYNHATLEHLIKEGMIDSDTSYRKITTVRNPWDWIYSIFCHYNLRSKLSDSIGLNVVNDYSKSGFIKWWQEKGRTMVLDPDTTGDGKIKNMIIDNSDFVIMFEDYEKSVEVFMKNFINIDYNAKNLKLRKLNVNINKAAGYGYRHFYNKKVKDEVGEIFLNLIKKHNYQF